MYMDVILVETTIQILLFSTVNLCQGHLRIISVYYTCGSIYIVATTEIPNNIMNIAITMFLKEQN